MSIDTELNSSLVKKSWVKLTAGPHWWKESTLRTSKPWRQRPPGFILSWNKNLQKPFDLFIKVELTDENVELRVFLKDVSDETSRFLIYLRNGSFPDEKTHDAVQSIPRILEAGESWDDNAVKNEAEYTAVFPIEVLNGVGNYYLGVVLMGK